MIWSFCVLIEVFPKQNLFWPFMLLQLLFLNICSHGTVVSGVPKGGAV